MITIDFDRLGVRPGDRVLDMGCGAGRHAFETYRRGADVVAFDQDVSELETVAQTFAAMAAGAQVPEEAQAVTHAGDALALPFEDAEFDHVIASEVLEHIPDDVRAIAELHRVLKPGGTMAVSVPRRWPERICWALSDEYHEVEGGHVRIYDPKDLTTKLTDTGLRMDGRAYAHSLHSAYWWLKCAVGVDNAEHPLVRAYHRLLVWDIMKRPWPTRLFEAVFDPIAGKSIVFYLTKPLT